MGWGNKRTERELEDEIENRGVLFSGGDGGGGAGGRGNAKWGVFARVLCTSMFSQGTGRSGQAELAWKEKLIKQVHVIHMPRIGLWSHKLTLQGLHVLLASVPSGS